MSSLVSSFKLHADFLFLTYHGYWDNRCTLIYNQFGASFVFIPCSFIPIHNFIPTWSHCCLNYFLNYPVITLPNYMLRSWIGYLISPLLVISRSFTLAAIVCVKQLVIWNTHPYPTQAILVVLTLKVLVATIDAQWEGMGDVGSARYEPALLPPSPTIRVLSYSN